MRFWRRIWSFATRLFERHHGADLRALVYQLRDAVDALQREIHALRAQNQTVNDPPLSKNEVLRPVNDRSLSKAECAKRLGVSKSRTLQPAIKAGRVRTVRVGKRDRIPADEFERIRSEGFVKPTHKKKPAPTAVRRRG